MVSIKEGLLVKVKYTFFEIGIMLVVVGVKTNFYSIW